jgi:HPt (histidine-containing phosphotransfer) domain-containing protein
MMNDDEVLAGVLERYLEDSPKLLQTMAQAVAQKQAADLGRAAHSLKSTSAMLGAKNLSQLCQELETMSLTACANTYAVSLASLVAMVSQVKTEYEKVQTTLQQKCQQLR